VGIVKHKQCQGGLKETFDISIDLECLGYLNDNKEITLHPCRKNAVNHLYDNGHKIIIFTSTKSEEKDNIIEGLKDLKYHQIIFDYVECDFIVSNKSREQTPFFNELFDRNYEIKHLPYLIEYFST